jgi:hypothetical protein
VSDVAESSAVVDVAGAVLLVPVVATEDVVDPLEPDPDAELVVGVVVETAGAAAAPDVVLELDELLVVLGELLEVLTDGPEVAPPPMLNLVMPELTTIEAVACMAFCRFV